MISVFESGTINLQRHQPPIGKPQKLFWNIFEPVAVILNTAGSDPPHNGILSNERLAPNRSRRQLLQNAPPPPPPKPPPLKPPPEKPPPPLKPDPIELERGEDTNTWCISLAMLCMELEK